MVLIIEPQSENESVNVILNKKSFRKTDKAILYINNVGSKTVYFGARYIIERKENSGWKEVSPFPSPSAWPAYLGILEPGRTHSQRVKIDTLETGQYRIIKEIYKDDTARAQEHPITFIVEFEIRG
jgi:hypothetical protein